MRLTRLDIEGLERRRRAALINSITGFKPANLVATADTAGRSNVAIISSLVHIGSNPPLLALVFRPDSADRHTLSNIRATGAYTINHVHENLIDAAHQTAARYPREVSEFAATGLTEHWEDGHSAPFVGEASVRMAMELREEQVLQINGTHLVIGEVMGLELPDHGLLDNGALDASKSQSVAIAGLDSYYRATLLQRMAYATPEQPARRIEP
jgi:flavin reductase (DIM6/NTAB) family NADH-FMN oxidoreductase RutF